MNRFEEADAAFDEWCSRAREETNPSLVLEQRRLAIARTVHARIRVLSNANCHKDAIAAANALLERFSTDPPAGRLDFVVSALRFKAIALASSGNPDEAIGILEGLVDHYGRLADLPVEKLVAQALENKAKLLDENGRHDQALECYDELLSRLRDPTAPELRELVAIALHNKLVLLQAAGRNEDALTTVDDVIARFGNDPPPGRPYLAVDALFNKTFFLHRLGRIRDAIDVYGEFAERYGEDSDPYVRAKLAVVLSARAEQLLRAGRYEEVATVADELLARFGEAPEAELRRHVADGLCNEADALGKLDRWEEALAVDERVIESFDDATCGAWPLSHKALALKKLGQTEQSIAVWGEVIAGYSDSSTPEVRELVASALAEKTELIALSGKHDEAVVLGEAMITRTGDEADPKQIALARGLGAKGAALLGEGRCEEAIKIFDTLVARFEDAQELQLRGQVALALNNKAVALSRLGQEEESTRVHQDLSNRFGEEALMVFDEHAKHCEEADGPHAREQWASMLYSKAWVLSDLGRPDEAMPILAELITRFADDKNATIQLTVSGARKAREEMIDNQRD